MCWKETHRSGDIAVKRVAARVVVVDLLSLIFGTPRHSLAVLAQFSPVTIQSIVRPDNLFSLSNISSVGTLCAFSYFESCAWLIPSILANSP